MQKYIVPLLAMCWSLTSIGQTINNDSRLGTVNRVIDGYNNHDYGAMRKPWNWWAKPIVTRNKLKREFEAYHTRYGALLLDTILKKSKFQYIAKLRAEKEPRTTLYLSYIFSNNGHLQGFGQTYPELIYRKAPPSRLNVAALTNDIDSYIIKKYTRKASNGFNGCIAVLENGQPVYERCIGYADFNKKNLLNDSTFFELASVSKQFSAVAILLLEKQGKLKLTDTLRQYFPALPYRNITIEQLLTHTSGLPDYEKLLKKEWDRTKFATNNDVVAQLAEHHPRILFPAGTRFEYCNTGYVLLSSIIEQVSGRSYAAFLKENIFEPLRMTHTRIYNTRRAGPELLNNYAYGYVYSNDHQKYLLPDSMEKYAEVRYQDPITGDGTVNSCILDLEKWEKEVQDPQIIPKEIFDMAFTNHTLPNGILTNYGYGFFLSGGNGTEPLTFHTGGWPGYTTIIVNFIQQKKQLIILSNNEYANFSRMADDIGELLTQ
jgi:CubicO group peptidase (beta-lactamase class C family)